MKLAESILSIDSECITPFFLMIEFNVPEIENLTNKFGVERSVDPFNFPLQDLQRRFWTQPNQSQPSSKQRTRICRHIVSSLSDVPAISVGTATRRPWTLHNFLLQQWNDKPFMFHWNELIYARQVGHFACLFWWLCILHVPSEAKLLFHMTWKMYIAMHCLHAQFPQKQSSMRSLFLHSS